MFLPSCTEERTAGEKDLDTPPVTARPGAAVRFPRSFPALVRSREEAARGPERVVPEETDETLVSRYGRGEVAAFEALLDRHRRGVFRFLRRFVGSDARAEDLAQETWLRFIGAAPRWKERGRFKVWLYAVARNLATDDARRASHRAAEPLEPAAGTRSRARIEAVADAAERDVLLRSALERAITALPEEQREVFLLREYEGIAFAEIAEITGAPLPTVKSRMRYALEALRKALLEGPGGVALQPGSRSAAR